MEKFRHRISKVASSRRFHTIVVGSHGAYFSLGAIGIPGYRVVMAFLAIAAVIELIAGHGE